MTLKKNTLGARTHRRARTHFRNGNLLLKGAKTRMGKVRVAVRRCFIVSNGQPILVRDVLEIVIRAPSVSGRGNTTWQDRRCAVSR